MPLQQRFERFWREQRHVAVEEEQRPCASSKRCFGGQECLRGPTLWFLNHKGETRVTREGCLDIAGPTATQDLQRLRRDGWLEQEGGGRSIRYVAGKKLRENWSAARGR